MTTAQPGSTEAERPQRGVAMFWALMIRCCSWLRWYTRELMGDSKYERYVRHLAAHHPGEAPLSERQFWRAHYAEQDANPGARCC